MIYSVTRSFYHGLVKNGVRIYEWTPGFCHAKMSVADDCMATCGTINLDYRSLYHHFENGCFMADSPAVLSIRNDLEETMNNYAGVSRKQPESTFAGVLELDPYSRGMGGMGIPGDLSSQSRFVKVAFTKLNAISGDGENESVSQFFHILGSVDQQRGCCEVSEGAYEITIYTSCCNTTKGIYYYTTYDNHQITAVDMYAENLDSDKLIRYPIILNGEIRWHNK